MIIICCSKPQHTDAVTPSPLVHRSHSCMRALALGHGTPPQGSRGGGPTSTGWSLSLISDNAGPGKICVRPSANINLVPIQSTVISSNSTASLTLRCHTCMCLERSLETGFTAIRLALLLSPYIASAHQWLSQGKTSSATSAWLLQHSPRLALLRLCLRL